ncbi:MAG: biopolymer transporter ExbD [Candidatus Dependentiae bacterium]|nr:biopolymer transporter ExbD [Candidatus Dependentiae bacterium]
MKYTPYRRKRTGIRAQEISLTPLIDTALTLLIIFMVTTPMMHNAIKVNLPEGKSNEVGTAQQELVVYLTSDEQLFFNGVPVTKDNLVATVQNAVEKQTGRPVFVKADEKVNYGAVMHVVNTLKMVGGIEYVGMATKRA